MSRRQIRPGYYRLTTLTFLVLLSVRPVAGQDIERITEV